MMKVLLVSSAGGHYSELKKITLGSKYESIVVVEKLNNEKENIDYYLKYSTRSKLLKYMFVFIFNFFKALYIIIKERPKIIISTGAHSCVAFFYIGKFLNIKTVYVESFAKVNSSSLTYKLIKKTATKVIVQHKEMLEEYEDSQYFGGIY